jgi:hypothetical protein
MFLPRYGYGHLGKKQGTAVGQINDHILGKLDLTASSVNARRRSYVGN